MAKNMMPNMYPNGSSYKPPSGSAGKAAFGHYSYKKNYMSVPKKGSEIRSMADYGRHADKAKVERLESEQARAENLRGIGC